MGYRNKKHKLQRSSTSPPTRDSLEPEAAVGPEESAPKLRLLDRVRQAIRTRHYSPRTEKAYVHWTKRFIFFHNKRHPDTMGEREISAFLTHLANRANVSASTQNQKLYAVIFLYRHVLRRDLDDMEFVRAKRQKKTAPGSIPPRSPRRSPAPGWDEAADGKSDLWLGRASAWNAAAYVSKTWT